MGTGGIGITVGSLFTVAVIGIGMRAGGIRPGATTHTTTTTFITGRSLAMATLRRSTSPRKCNGPWLSKGTIMVRLTEFWDRERAARFSGIKSTMAWR